MAQPHKKNEAHESVGAEVSAAAMRSNHALLLVDGSTLRILDINNACFATLGYPLEILLGLRLTDLVTIKDRDVLSKAIDSLSDGSSWNSRLVCDIQRGDGGSLPISLSLEIDADPHSSRVKLLATMSEISESEQLYLSMETALAAAGISFANWTLNSETLAPWHRKDSGKQKIQAPSNATQFLNKLNPVDRRETSALLDAVSSGMLSNIDTTVTTTEANGETRWLHLTGVVPAHKPGTLLALCSDVTESYRMTEIKEERENALRLIEDQLHRSESELHELLALVPDFIVRLDTRAVIKYASPSFSTDCKRREPDMVGASLISVLSTDTRAAFSEALGCLTEFVTMHEFVSEETHNGKERSVWWTLLKMNDEHTDKGVLCLGRDITDRAQARRQLERQAKQLKRSNASLDDFASVVSHDLQAPMRHIVNFSEMLEAEMQDSEEDSKKYLEVIKTAALRLQDMTSNLLNYSRLGLQNDRLTQRPIAELIAEAIDMLSEPMKASKAKVEMGLLPELCVDPLLMARLFQNLLSNSIKYCDSGITPNIHVSATKEHDSWVIYWTDRGIGIDPTQSERIFKIFTRLHADESVYAGSGVGLALCKRIVESHGGDMWLDTDYLDGARFAIRLPIVDEEENELYQ